MSFVIFGYSILLSCRITFPSTDDWDFLLECQFLDRHPYSLYVVNFTTDITICISICTYTNLVYMISANLSALPAACLKTENIPSSSLFRI